MGCLGLAVLGLTALLAAESANHPPNIVLLIGDDQAWTDYGFTGHPVIKTPHLDRLAAEGHLFTRAYVPTSLCRPSLATMVTGLYPHQHGITGNDPPAPPPGRGKRFTQDERDAMMRLLDDDPKLPKLLADKGYQSLQTGKWWESAFQTGGFTAGMTHGQVARGGRHGDEGLKIGREGLEPIRKFLADTKGKPFLLWYAPFMPHTPHTPPARLLQKYTAPDRDPALAKYFAMCEWFDETCGGVRQLLDEAGVADNTMIVFMCDNGWIQPTKDKPNPPNWSQPFAPRSKRSPHEGGVRSPIIVHWPGRVAPARDEETLASTIDVVPTVLDAVGLPRPAQLPGISLFDAAALKARPRIFGEIFLHDMPDLHDPKAALLYRWVIEGRYKLIDPSARRLAGKTDLRHTADTGPELYDLQADPTEQSNLAADQPERVAELRRQLDAWWKVGE